MHVYNSPNLHFIAHATGFFDSCVEEEDRNGLNERSGWALGLLRLVPLMEIGRQGVMNVQRDDRKGDLVSVSPISIWNVVIVSKSVLVHTSTKTHAFQSRILYLASCHLQRESQLIPS